MTIPVVLGALLFWAAVFMIYFTSQGTTPLEFFFGRYEPLPDGLGAWKPSGTAEDAALLREERWLLAGGRAGSGQLLRQVRYRDVATRAIVRVEPEQRVRRRRVSTRSSE